MQSWGAVPFLSCRGFSVVYSDADVIWLRDPLPLFDRHPHAGLLLRFKFWLPIARYDMASHVVHVQALACAMSACMRGNTCCIAGGTGSSLPRAALVVHQGTLCYALVDLYCPQTWR